MCRLFGVTRQGYYAYAHRPPSKRVRAEAKLCAQVKEVFEEMKQAYGSPRILRELRKRGFVVGKRRIERAMRGMGLTPPTPRRHRSTTVRDPAHPVAPNDLARDFTATRPNERWVTDITYVWTDEGWAYVAVLLDLFSRAVVGWAVDASLSTRLPLAALDAAVRRRRPGARLMHHSDRGCQYTSAHYRQALAELAISVSMSRTGNCWDNAVAESFFATLKNELVYRRPWPNRLELRTALFEYIEVFYNRKRLHSSLGYKTPAEAELEYANAAKAA
jgi:putative transposase